MKKILLATAIVLGITTFSQNIIGTENVAIAQEKNMSTTFVNKLEKGTLPKAEGKVGMTLKTLKSKGKVSYYPAEEFSLYRSKNYDYGFYNTRYNQKVKSSSKIKIVIREYNFSFSKSSIKKKLGKQLPTYGQYGYQTKTDIYKVGKYYAMVFDIDKKTNVYVGTKTAICTAAWVDEIYD